MGATVELSDEAVAGQRRYAFARMFELERELEDAQADLEDLRWEHAERGRVDTAEIEYLRRGAALAHDLLLAGTTDAAREELWETLNGGEEVRESAGWFRAGGEPIVEKLEAIDAAWSRWYYGDDRTALVPRPERWRYEARLWLRQGATVADFDLAVNAAMVRGGIRDRWRYLIGVVRNLIDGRGRVKPDPGPVLYEAPGSGWAAKWYTAGDAAMLAGLGWVPVDPQPETS